MDDFVNDKWKLYTNSTYNFSIKYPHGYRVEVNKNFSNENANLLNGTLVETFGLQFPKNDTDLTNSEEEVIKSLGYDGLLNIKITIITGVNKDIDTISELIGKASSKKYTIKPWVIGGEFASVIDYDENPFDDIVFKDKSGNYLFIFEGFSSYNKNEVNFIKYNEILSSFNFLN